MIAPSYREAQSSEPGAQSSEPGRPCFFCPPTTGCQRVSGRRTLDTRPATSCSLLTVFGPSSTPQVRAGIHTHRIASSTTVLRRTYAVSGEVMRGVATPVSYLDWAAGDLGGEVGQCEVTLIQCIPPQNRKGPSWSTDANGGSRGEGTFMPSTMFVYRSCFEPSFTAHLCPEERARRFGMTLSNAVMHLFWV